MQVVFVDLLRNLIYLISHNVADLVAVVIHVLPESEIVVKQTTVESLHAIN